MDQAPPDPAGHVPSKERGEKGTGALGQGELGNRRHGRGRGSLFDGTDKSLIFNAERIVLGMERAAKLLGAL